ncbi:hypothetical protein TgHK011_007934 [Trichoderma gracile]|nr:hypothetical protein TgHK011_007934 [Trichoderma gracile]
MAVALQGLSMGLDGPVSQRQTAGGVGAPGAPPTAAGANFVPRLCVPCLLASNLGYPFTGVDSDDPAVYSYCCCEAWRGMAWGSPAWSDESCSLSSLTISSLHSVKARVKQLLRSNFWPMLIRVFNGDKGRTSHGDPCRCFSPLWARICMMSSPAEAWIDLVPEGSAPHGLPETPPFPCPQPICCRFQATVTWNRRLAIFPVVFPSFPICPGGLGARGGGSRGGIADIRPH